MKTAYFNRFELPLPREAAIDCSRPGQSADASVEFWQSRIDRPSQITPEKLRDELKEYGAWDSDELTDDGQNWRRIIWIAACGISEQRHEDIKTFRSELAEKMPEIVAKERNLCEADEVEFPYDWTAGEFSNAVENLSKAKLGEIFDSVDEEMADSVYLPEQLAGMVDAEPLLSICDEWLRAQQYRIEITKLGRALGATDAQIAQAIAAHLTLVSELRGLLTANASAEKGAA